jgi:Cd(II)/Pb(II)-responsive transcriptional regulator
MKIGELARVTGTPVETLRYYEREEMLPAPARTEGNFRVYSKAHVDRVLFIRHCRSLDMALDEIRVLLAFKDAPGENCAGVNALLDEHIGHVAARIRELRALQRQLIQLRERCDDVQETARCGIMRGLAQPLDGSGTMVPGHIRGVHARVRARER